MAYYECECQECGKWFEIVRSSEEDKRQPKLKCPNCDSEHLAHLEMPTVAQRPTALPF